MEDVRQDAREVAKDLIIEWLEDSRDYEPNVYINDLGYMVTDCINCTGSYHCNTYEAIEFIKANWYLMGACVEHYNDEMGMLLNPFKEPEKCEVVLILRLVEQILFSCDFINNNIDNQMNLMNEDIEQLIKEVKEIDLSNIEIYY